MLQLQAACIEQANEGFAALGLQVGGVQLEGGSRLNGLVQAAQCGVVVFMRTSFDQRVHFTGQPMAGMAPFAVMSAGESWYHGDTSTGSDLCGFGDHCSSNTDTHWVGCMNVIYVPRDLLRFNLQQCGAVRAQQRLMSCNNVAFTGTDHGEFLRMHSKGLAGAISRESQVIDMLTLMLDAPVPFELVRESQKISPRCGPLLKAAAAMPKMAPPPSVTSSVGKGFISAKPNSTSSASSATACPPRTTSSVGAWKKPAAP